MRTEHGMMQRTKCMTELTTAMKKERGAERQKRKHNHYSLGKDQNGAACVSQSSVFTLLI